MVPKVERETEVPDLYYKEENADQLFESFSISINVGGKRKNNEKSSTELGTKKWKKELIYMEKFDDDLFDNLDESDHVNICLVVEATS